MIEEYGLSRDIANRNVPVHHVSVFFAAESHPLTVVYGYIAHDGARRRPGCAVKIDDPIMIMYARHCAVGERNLIHHKSGISVELNDAFIACSVAI
jgi:hypothetical protein